MALVSFLLCMVGGKGGLGGFGGEGEGQGDKFEDLSGFFIY